MKLQQGWCGTLLTATVRAPGAGEATAKAHTSATPGGHSTQQMCSCNPGQRPDLGLSATREQNSPAGTSALVVQHIQHACLSRPALPYHIWLFHAWPQMAFLLMATFPLHTGSWVDDNIMFPCKPCMWSCVLFLVLFHLQLKLLMKPFISWIPLHCGQYKVLTLMRTMSDPQVPLQVIISYSVLCPAPFLNQLKKHLCSRTNCPSSAPRDAVSACSSFSSDQPKAVTIPTEKQPLPFVQPLIFVCPAATEVVYYVCHPCLLPVPGQLWIDDSIFKLLDFLFLSLIFWFQNGPHIYSYQPQQADSSSW